MIDFDLNLFILRVILREPKKSQSDAEIDQTGDTYTDNNVGPVSVQQ